MERVWAALQPLLATVKKDDVEKSWDELLERSSETDFMDE
jgi:hypothetical protein